MNEMPEVTSPEQIYEREGRQSMQPTQRPSWWGVDLDPSRRPGVPRELSPPRPFPNTHFPPERQAGQPSSPMHGRRNKKMPPVFSTAVPLRGLSGVIRRAAYRLPDHYPSHWMLKMLGDRVDAWTYHAKKYSVYALPVMAAALLLRGKRQVISRSPLRKFEPLTH